DARAPMTAEPGGLYVSAAHERRLVRSRLGMWIAVALLASTVGCGTAPDPEAAPADSTMASAPPIVWNGSFAFANATGTELLTLATDSLNQRLHEVDFRWALCEGAKRVAVSHVRAQEADPASNGRQIADNFKREAGEVYASGASDFEPSATCFL